MPGFVLRPEEPSHGGSVIVCLSDIQMLGWMRHEALGLCWHPILGAGWAARR